MAVKQVIVVNVKVPMGIGQLAAQAAHASIAVLLDMGEWTDRTKFEMNDISSSMIYWMKKSFTKIVVKAWGEEELMDLLIKAKEVNLPTSQIVDYGHLTAIAIGPDKADVIDSITGDLPLL